jgi:hypothetical protein
MVSSQMSLFWWFASFLGVFVGVFFGRLILLVGVIVGVFFGGCLLVFFLGASLFCSLYGVIL